jgi:hypothetical protein
MHRLIQEMNIHCVRSSLLNIDLYTSTVLYPQKDAYSRCSHSKPWVVPSSMYIQFTLTYIYILCTYDADFYVKHCKTAMIFFPTKLLRPVASQQPFQLPRQQLPGSQQQQQLKASEPQGATDLQRSAFRAHEMPEIPEVSG